MSLASFKALNFRNFESLDLVFDPQVNFIIGDNGSGKTSLLDAIFYMSHGRSFNTSQHHKVIRFDQDNFVLSAEVVKSAGVVSKANSSLDASLDTGLISNRVGIRRYKDSQIDMRINGKPSQRLSALAKILPVQLITPDSFKLFFGGPKERRQFFDFGVFHVKPDFYQHWLRFTKIHRHRNALLKQHPSKYNQEFEYWDTEFCQLAQQLNQTRQAYLDVFQTQFEQATQNIDSMLSDAGIKFQLFPGFSMGSPLLEQLQRSFTKDAKFGFTSIGPHKADVKVKSDKRLVEDVLSRGQLKLLLYVIKLIQSSIISQYNMTPVMLLDDIASEVDNANLTSIFSFLQLSQQTQFFITGLNAEIVKFLNSENHSHAVFHVKHGTIQQNTRI